VNNAIRYNRENGRIRLSDEVVPGESYRLHVEDTGIGISAEELPAIFNRFKKSAKEEGEGYGLGLSIAKSIADFHGFDIKVTSRIGEGTVFSVIVPWADLERS
jgi:signal transduction histidine kinase